MQNRKAAEKHMEAKRSIEKLKRTSITISIHTTMEQVIETGQ